MEAVLQTESNPGVFVCGPPNTPLEKKRARQDPTIQLQPKFMESVLEMIQTAGVDPRRIKHEGWG